MPITDSQLASIQEKVATLVADKADADAKTQAANTAVNAAKIADAAAAQANLDEAAADAKAGADLQDLSNFIDGLVGAPAVPPAMPAPVAG